MSYTVHESDDAGTVSDKYRIYSRLASGKTAVLSDDKTKFSFHINKPDDNEFDELKEEIRVPIDACTYSGRTGASSAKKHIDFFVECANDPSYEYCVKVTNIGNNKVTVDKVDVFCYAN